jgi:hypothetical protein
MKNLDQVQQPIERSLWLCTLQGYGHTLSIIRNKHQKDFKRSLIQHAMVVSAQVANNESKQK